MLECMSTQLKSIRTEFQTPIFLTSALCYLPLHNGKQYQCIGLSGCINLAESNAHTNESLSDGVIVLKSIVRLGDIMIAQNLT